MTLKIVFILANSADPDEMLPLALHCLPSTYLSAARMKRVERVRKKSTDNHVCKSISPRTAQPFFFQFVGHDKMLTLKAPITTAADDKFCDIFPNFRKK